MVVLEGAWIDGLVDGWMDIFFIERLRNRHQDSENYKLKEEKSITSKYLVFAS
jgi:hypothetical protein